MSTPLRPINKQASIFLSHRTRIETLQEALDKFATRVCGPEVAAAAASMLADDKEADPPMLQISIKIARDERDPTKFFAILETGLKRRLNREHLGLLG